MFVRGLGELALASRLKALSDRLYDAVDEVYADHGAAIQSRWFPLLRLLLDKGPMPVTSIAQALGQTHPAISQMATRIERAGLIVRRRDDGDERRSLLALTPEGERILVGLKPLWGAMRAAVADTIERSGRDLLGAIAALESELDRTRLPDAIAREHTARQRAQVRIVPFEPRLREHFYKLNAEWLTKYYFIEQIDHDVLSNPEEVILQHGGAILFALLGDEVIGTCALKQESPGVFELTKMGVTERCQGLGVGRRLLEATVAEFQRLGGKTLFLESQEKLQAALHLYESVGFVRQPGRRPDSHYQRSDVYMIWQAPKTRAAAKKRRERATA